MGYFSGLAYLGLENYDRALDFLQRAVDIARENNKLGGVSESLGYIRNVYLDLEQHDRALGYYREALQIAEDLEKKYFETNANTFLSFYYIAIDDLSTATQYVYRALNLALENEIPVDLFDAISDSTADEAMSGGQIAALEARHKLEQKMVKSAQKCVDC